MSAVVDCSRLAELETVIERGKQTFVEVGQALMGIRDGRLYRETHATFEAYCQKRWGFTHRFANLQIAAATVSGNLGSQTDLGYKQAVALAPLSPEQQRDVAEHIDFSSATAEAVRQAVRFIKEHARTYPSPGATRCCPPATSGTRPPSTSNRRAPSWVPSTLTRRLTSGPTRLRAATFYDERSNGLLHDWPGRVWLNPPYGGQAADFTGRLVSQFAAGHHHRGGHPAERTRHRDHLVRPDVGPPAVLHRHRIAFYGPDGIQRIPARIRVRLLRPQPRGLRARVRALGGRGREVAAMSDRQIRRETLFVRALDFAAVELHDADPSQTIEAHRERLLAKASRRARTAPLDPCVTARALVRLAAELDFDLPGDVGGDAS